MEPLTLASRRLLHQLRTKERLQLIDFMIATGDDINTIATQIDDIKQLRRYIRRGPRRQRCTLPKYIPNFDLFNVAYWKSNEYALGGAVMRSGVVREEDKQSMIRFLTLISGTSLAIWKQRVKKFTSGDFLALFDYLAYRLVAYARCHKSTKDRILYRVYRGERPLPLKQGKVWADPAPLYTTAHKGYTEHMIDLGAANIVSFVLRVKKGTPIINTWNMFYHNVDTKSLDKGVEYEFVLPPQTGLLLNSVQKENGIIKVYADVLPTDYIPGSHLTDVFDQVENFFAKHCTARGLKWKEKGVRDDPQDWDLAEPVDDLADRLRKI